MTLKEAIELYSQLTQLRFTLLREWQDEGHPVCWVLCEMPSFPSARRYELRCLCEFQVDAVLPTGFEEGRGSSMGYQIHHDNGGCAIKDVVASALRSSARQQFGKSWDMLGTDRAIVNVFNRSLRGVPFGQSHSDELLPEEIGEIIGLANPELQLGHLMQKGVVAPPSPYSPYWKLVQKLAD